MRLAQLWAGPNERALHGVSSVTQALAQRLSLTRVLIRCLMS